MGNKDKTRDGDATASETRDSHANRDHSRDREASRDATLAKIITKAVALQTKSSLSCFQNKKQRRHSPSLKHLQGRWRRHMCNTRGFSRKIAQPPCQPPLKLLHHQMDLE